MAAEFVLAALGGGFRHDMLIEVDSDKTIHRESKSINTWGPTYTFSAAKSCLPIPSLDADVIVGLDEEGAACEVWAPAQQINEVKERLKTWAGCYGTWPVRALSEEKENIHA